MKELEPHEPFCWNSRRWVWLFDLNGLPKSCPYKGDQGTVACVGERCGYYEERPITTYAYRKWKDLTT